MKNSRGFSYFFSPNISASCTYYHFKTTRNDVTLKAVFFLGGGGGIVFINVNPRRRTYSAKVQVHSQATQCWSPLQLYDMQS